MQGVQVRFLVGDPICHAAWPKDKQKIKLSSHHVVPGTSQVSLLVKNLPVNAGDGGEVGSVPGYEDPLEEGTATHSKSHGQRSLASYSPQGCKELDTTEVA